MLLAEVCLCICAYLGRKDLDALLLVSRRFGNLSQRASRARPRRISLHHLHEGQFDLDFEAIRRAVAFDDLPIYLHESQLTEVYVDGTMLTEDTIHGTTLHFLRFSFSHSLLISYFQRFTCVSRTIVTRRCCLYDQ